MSQPTQKVPYKNREADAESIKFNSEGENWNIYKLADGSELKIKLVLMDVLRLKDEFSDNGDPIYVIAAQQVLGVLPNPELKKKKE